MIRWLTPLCLGILTYLNEAGQIHGEALDDSQATRTHKRFMVTPTMQIAKEASVEENTPLSQDTFSKQEDPSLVEKIAEPYPVRHKDAIQKSKKSTSRTQKPSSMALPLPIALFLQTSPGGNGDTIFTAPESHDNEVNNENELLISDQPEDMKSATFLSDLSDSSEKTSSVSSQVL